jgi:hypothetical protein
MESLREQLNTVTENSLARMFTENKVTLSNLPRATGKPIFVIKYGPPASGKGSGAVRQIIENLGQPLRSYMNFNVDDVVESTQYFNKTSRDLVNNLLVRPNSANFNKFLNKASVDEVAKFSKVYTDVRFAKNSSGRNIGAKMDDLLKRAVEKGVNITFETTGGGSFPSWIWGWLQKDLKKYKIVIVFPTVPFNEIWRRYKMRPTQQYLRGGGFRFASTKAQVRKVYRDSYLHMSEALGSGKVNWIDEIFIIGHNSDVLTVYPKKTAGRRQGQAVRDYLSGYLSTINSNS